VNYPCRPTPVLGMKVKPGEEPNLDIFEDAPINKHVNLRALIDIVLSWLIAFDITTLRSFPVLPS